MTTTRSRAGSDEEYHETHSYRGSVIAVVLCVLVSGTVISLGAWTILRDNEARAAEERLDRRAQLVGNAVTTEVARFTDTTRNIASSISGQTNLEREDFEAATRSLREMNLAGAVSVNWLVPGTTGDAAAIEGRWRSLGAGNGNGVFETTSGDEHYWVVYSTALGEDAASPFGSDASRSPAAVEVLRLARDSGEVQMSQPYQFRRDSMLPDVQRQNSFVIAAPVFTETADPTAREFRGWLTMALRGGNFVTEVFNRASQGLVNVTLVTNGLDDVPTEVAVLRTGRPTDESRTIDVSVARSTWQLQVTGASRELSADGSRVPAFALALLLVMTVLLSALTYVLATGRARARNQVRRATHELAAAGRQSREQAMLLGSMLSSLNEGVVVVDADGEPIIHNVAATDLLGPLDSTGRNYGLDNRWHMYSADGSTMIDPADTAIARALAGETVVDEVLVRHGGRPDGAFVSVTATPLDETAGHEGAVAVFRDVTTARRYTATLEKLNHELGSANRFNEQLFEASPDASLIVDARGRITAANQVAGHLFGRTPRDLAQMHLRQLVPDLQSAIEEMVTTGSSTVFLTGWNAAGTALPLDILFSPLRAPTGTLTIVALRDATARLRDESVLRLAQREAERANNAKSEFLSRVSHELRTPLAAVLGFAAVLEMDKDSLSRDHLDMVGRIDRAGRHLLNLINDVLDISRVESGNLSLHLEPVSIAHVFDDAGELVEQMCFDRGINFVHDVNEDLMAYADRSRLQQVVVNLLSNAAKYNSEGGSITVTSELAVETVVFRISDTGPGIDKEMLTRLFMPFDRLGAESTPTEGTGLGLALSKALIEQMNGTIVVDNTGPGGTTFAVTLPRPRIANLDLPRIEIDTGEINPLA